MDPRINYLANITLYRSANTSRGETVTITDFVQMGKNFSDRQIAYRSLKQSVAEEPDEAKRAAADQYAKRYKTEHFPAATLSGEFDPNKRSKQTLLHHSGWLCIDIDDHIFRTDSTGTKREYAQSLVDVPDKLQELPWVSYAAHSVGGVGYYALIPLAKMPLDGLTIIESHEWYFDCLAREFSQIGITIDPACRDVTRLRFVSYDPEPIVRRPISETVAYEGIAGFESRNDRHRRMAEEARRIEAERRKAQFAGNNTDWDYRNVAKCCERMEQLGANVAESYEDWKTIGCALAKQFGEEGRDFFNRISSMSTKFNLADNNKAYSGFLRTISSSSEKDPITMASIYAIFSANGIHFMNNK